MSSRLFDQGVALVAAGWNDCREGGYRRVTFETDRGVQEAAAYAVSKLPESAKIYPFAATFSGTMGTNDVAFKVVRAYVQIAAGTTYRLVILLVNEEKDESVGAFAVTVYERLPSYYHLGRYEVIWGKLVACSDALELLNNCFKQFGWDHSAFLDDYSDL
jgi:hypothetical protein